MTSNEAIARLATDANRLSSEAAELISAANALRAIIDEVLELRHGRADLISAIERASNELLCSPSHGSYKALPILQAALGQEPVGYGTPEERR